jgi:hypothetical protein
MTAIDKFSEYREMHRFLSTCENVFLNFGPIKNPTTPPLEQVYIYNIIKDLSRWPSFSLFKFYLLNAYEPYDFEFDDHSVVFLFSNENHQVPERILKAKLICSPYSPIKDSPSNCLPIPLGYNGSIEPIPYVAINERPFTVFFSGQIHRRRFWFFINICIHFFLTRIHNLTSKKKLMDRINLTRKFTGGLSPTEYSNSLMNSKIACVPQGYKSDISFRFFEAARAGNVIITKKLYDFWFFKDFPGIEVSNWFQFHWAWRSLNNNPEKMKKISEQMLTYYQSKCSEEAVTKKIIDTLNSMKQ